MLRPPRDWHEITKLYVFGEVIGRRSDGTTMRAYPSIRDLSARLGIARSVLANHSKREGWVAARERFQAMERERAFAAVAREATAPRQ